jgi:hypothetical protein
MNTRRSTQNRFAALLAIYLLSGAICQGIEENFKSVLRLLKESHLTGDRVLNNQPEIYQNVAALLDEKGPVEKFPEMGSKDVALAWASNPAADKLPFEIRLARGETLLEAIEQVALQRGEELTVTRNYIAITPKQKLRNRFPYQMDAEKTSNEVKLALGTLAPTGITLIQPGARGMEDFLNEKLKRTAEIGGHETSPITIKVDDSAKPSTAKLNVIGPWVYQDLFDAIAGVCNLRWRCQESTILFIEEKR